MRPSLAWLWLAATTAIYAACVAGLGWATGHSFNDLELNVREGGGAVQAVTVVALVAGYALAYVLPGLVVISRSADGPDALLRAFVASVVLHSLILTIVKIAGYELVRSWFVVSCAGLCLATVGWRRPRAAMERADRVAIAATAGVALVLVAIFFQKIFAEDLGADGTEHFEYARSLRTHLLPFWDLDFGAWGFHHRFFFFAFPSLLSLLSAGEIEAAVRLPGVIYAAGIFLTILLLLPRDRRARPAVLATLAGGVLLVFFVNAYYSTWEPWFADIAEPTATDLLATGLVLAGLHFLRAGRHGWFVTFAVLGAVSTQFGAALTVLSLVVMAASSVDRRLAVVGGLRFGAAYAAVLAAVALYHVWNPIGFSVFATANLLEYWALLPSLDGIGIQLLFLVIMCGGLALVVVPTLGFGDRLTRQLFTVAVVYAAVLALSSRINPHYFLPSSILLVAAATRTVAQSARPWLPGAALIASFVVSAWAVTPAWYVPSRTASTLGARVRVEGADYMTRARLAQIAYTAFRFDDFGVSHHALLHYATRHPCVDCDYVITSSDVERAGYTRLDARDGSVIFKRTAGAMSLPTMPGATYCAPFLRSLYTAQRRRAEPRLKGPAELHWHICLTR